MLTILFWLWHPLTPKGPNYEPKHVDTAARMIHRNLTIPHRFVCATDWPLDSFDPLIEPIPLWDDWRNLRHSDPSKWGEHKPHCYVRLKAFSHEARELIGERFVSVDIDCLVLDSLDPVFSRTEDFIIYHRHLPCPTVPNSNPYNGSMWMMTAGARAQVWETFKGKESVAAASARIGSDQAWIMECLASTEAGWTAKDGVLAFPHVKADKRWQDNEPPVDARIIFFMGGDKPWHYIPEPVENLPRNHRDSRSKNRKWNEPSRFKWIERYYW